MGLVSSFEVETEELDTPDPRAIMGVVTADSWADRGFETLRLMSVRLPPPLSRAWLAARQRYGETLLDIVDAHQGLLCLLGDLNATPLWPVYRMLTRSLDDGVRKARRSVLSRGSTWPSPLPLLRIDHVLVRGLVVHRAQQLTVRGTDHKGLLVEVTRELGA